MCSMRKHNGIVFVDLNQRILDACLLVLVVALRLKRSPKIILLRVILTAAYILTYNPVFYLIYYLTYQ